jgi:uncharacterized membrane protein
MTQHTFGIQESVSFGWEKTKEHFWFLAGAALIFAVVSGATTHMPGIGLLVGLALAIATIELTFRIADGHVPHLKDALKPLETYKVFWHSLLATLLYILVVVAGLIVFILPGIYLAVTLKFYMYEIVEHGTKPWDAIGKSYALTKGHFWKLFFFNMILLLLNIAGALLLGIGLLFTVPVSMIAYTHVYRRLEGHKAPSHEESRHIA